MQVQKINNNGYNTSFGAKLIISGFTDDIGKHTRKLWREKAKQIGSDKDVIKLKFSKRKEHSDSYAEMGEHFAWTTKSRDIFATAKINGTTLYDKKDIGYSTSADVNTYNLVNKNVQEFLNKLIGKKNISS